MTVLIKVAAMFDELEKIGVSVGLSDFRQTRKGTRPLRVATLLRKDKSNATREPDPEDTNDYTQREPESGHIEIESGRGFSEGNV